jgi:endo-1,4-beta-xylanase
LSAAIGLRLLASLLLVGLAAGRAAASDCGDAPRDCTLAETAAQASFWIGAAVKDSAAQPSTQAAVPTHFNSITAENAMKWGNLARTLGSYDFGDADGLVEFAEQKGARVRGHTLLWGRGPQPADLEAEIAAAADPQQRMRELLAEHIGTVVGRYAGRVQSWDVVNEPLAIGAGELDRNLFFLTLGESYIAEAFRLAHEADPSAQLFLNEFFLSYDGQKPQAFLALVGRLLADGVPIHGVGVQAHFDAFLPLPFPTRAEFQGFLEQLADLGLAVELTELDISINYFLADAEPFARQAEAYGEVTAACVAVPACQGITTWGIDDAGTWLDFFPPFHIIAPHHPLLFDADLQPKPAYFAVRDTIAARILSPEERLGALLGLMDESVAAGTLEGHGHGRAAQARLDRLRRALGRAEHRLEAGRVAKACRWLGFSQLRLDGTAPPRDLARGQAAPAFHAEIDSLREALDCHLR